MMQVTTPMIDVAVRETACHSFSHTHTQPQPPSASEICLCSHSTGTDIVFCCVILAGVTLIQLVAIILLTVGFICTAPYRMAWK